MKEALFYEKAANQSVKCRLCPHHCVIGEGKVGLCGVRENQGGKLYTLNYGKLSALQIDPIEKKPLYSFMPNTQTFSVGSYGCNLGCVFCQNFRIAKAVPETVAKEPEEIVLLAKEMGTPSISYTYNEPSMFYEFVYDTAKLAKQQGLKNVMVTNGYIEKEPLQTLMPYMDALNIDLKSFREETYQKYCNGHLSPVMDTIRFACRHSHVEVTTLVVTEMNDDEEELVELFQWLAAVDENIPLHLSRYFPRYRYDKEPTEVSFMQKMKQEAERFLNHVFLGNV